MGRTAKDKRPRALGGGRSARYESRREARNADRAYAPGWSDAAAAVVLEQLHAGSTMCGQKIVQYTRTVLTDPARAAEWEDRIAVHLSPADRKLVASIVRVHAEAIANKGERGR